ncbi:MAG: ABC transporter ATP-binding protein [Methanothermobacter sp.]|nr:ABC transporter ATP-binding protein [Methanothermobacter sp.]
MKVFAIEMEDLSYCINGREILRNINFRVPVGELLAVIGPNGGGKTTLLKLVTGQIKPSRGRVRVLGMKPEEARSRIGYLPQRSHFETDFPIDVLQTVMIGTYRKFEAPTDDDRKKALRALEMVGMLEYRDRKIGELSGGELQRVFLARALVREPDLLLLDEPTASVDPAFRGSFYRIIDELRGEMTIVIVSHDIGTVARHVDSVACLNHRLFVHGTVEEALKCIDDAYGCPVELLAHGIPHRVLEEHPDE